MSRHYQSVLRFHFLNTLIHIILIISHHPSSSLIMSSATLYALSLYISPRLRRCRAPPLAIPLPASSPWAPFWLTGLGVKPCVHTLHQPSLFDPRDGIVLLAELDDHCDKLQRSSVENVYNTLCVWYSCASDVSAECAILGDAVAGGSMSVCVRIHSDCSRERQS